MITGYTGIQTVVMQFPALALARKDLNTSENEFASSLLHLFAVAYVNTFKANDKEVYEL